MRPYINELFDKIEKDPELKGRVKMLGIAAGNDHFETALEEKRYQFPIIPDDTYEFHGLVGRPPTPFLIFARPYSDGRLLVVDSHLGRIEDSDKLFSMVNNAYNKSIPKTVVAVKKKEKTEPQEELAVPISQDELMAIVEQSFAGKGEKVLELKKVNLSELGDIYTGILNRSKRRVFARVVARRIPCLDCHDVFYVYSFDDKGRFIQFIPISISKLDNEDWNDKDINKMRSKFRGRSLLKERQFNPKVDAITSATISSKLIFDSMGETDRVVQKLVDMGYIKQQSNH